MENNYSAEKIEKAGGSENQTTLGSSLALRIAHPVPSSVFALSI